MGTSGLRRSILSATTSPFIPGIFYSSMTRSIAWEENIARPSAPLFAVITRYPCDWSVIFRIASPIVSSSTHNMTGPLIVDSIVFSSPAYYLCVAEMDVLGSRAIQIRKGPPNFVYYLAKASPCSQDSNIIASWLPGRQISVFFIYSLQIGHGRDEGWGCGENSFKFHCMEHTQLLSLSPINTLVATAPSSRKGYSEATVSWRDIARAH
jgi:hypothetical protein